MATFNGTKRACGNRPIVGRPDAGIGNVTGAHPRAGKRF